MVIILEGCDGSGKSTCWKSLCNNHPDYKFVKESYVEDIKDKLFKVDLVKDSIASKSTTIYDRTSLIDDIVYSPIIDGVPSILPETYGIDEYTKVLKDCTIIYFDIDPRVAATRLEGRGDEYIAVNQMLDIQSGYKEFFERFDIKPITINVTKLNRQEVREKVEEIINNEKSKNSADSSKELS